MYILLVVDNPKSWPLEIPGVEVVNARRYLTEPAFTRMSGARVFNLCRSYSYQDIGYYVSLLAAARGHKPVPDVSVIRDLQLPSIVRLASEDLEELIARNLANIKRDTFTLSIYFGRNLARRYDRLSLQLFNLFRAPLLRANFERTDGLWHLQSVGPISVNDVPESHHSFIVKAATEFFTSRRPQRRREIPAFTMGILHNPHEEHPPSNARALEHFIEAADRVGIEAELIERDDVNRLPEYDALFIRETTAVTNHTFRFARRAEAEGLVVIDDPLSILRCTNKVYLAERLGRGHVPMPRTVIVHRDNLDLVHYEIGFPCILKQPDSSFSEGVIKVSSRDELEQRGREMLEKSELLIAQEFLPTDFDWRIGMIDGRALYACKYFMAPRHWQIIQRKSREVKEGKVEAVPLNRVPTLVLRTALRAGKLIGSGLYGVDLKQVGKRCYVIEINDNPNIDAGYEDEVLKDRLYDTIVGVFLKRMKEIKRVKA